MTEPTDPLLTKEEAQLVIGAIPLQALPTNKHRAQSEDIRAAAKEIARFIESTTPLAVGQPMIAAFETIIREACVRTAPAAPDNLCPEHRTEFKLFEVGGCIKCWRDSEVESALKVSGA